MTKPITLDIPHQLGKAAVRARLDGGIGRVGTAIPGGAQVRHEWDGDTLNFTVVAMGQTVRAQARVFDDRVHAVVDLPPMLGLFAAKIRSILGREVPKLLG